MQKLFQSVVQPRVNSPITREPMLLVDEISGLLLAGEPLTITIVGDGKTTAVEFLQQHFREESNLRLFDCSEVNEGNQVLVFGGGREVLLRLCCWQSEDFIEYLLATSPSSCSSVMQRLRGQQLSFGEGSPFIWRPLLDAMVGDESLVEIEQTSRFVVKQLMARTIGTGSKNASNARWLMAQIVDTYLKFGQREMIEAARRLGGTSELIQVLRVRVVVDLIAADRVAERLKENDASALRIRTNIALLRRVAEQISKCPRVRDLLASSLGCKDSSISASLLQLMDPAWQPPQIERLNLTGGYFNGAKWAGSQIPRATLSKASMVGADLRAIKLANSFLGATDFRSADLLSASLVSVEAKQASFHCAKLDCCNAVNGRFQQCDLSEVSAYHANFANADLSQADLTCADFSGSIFSQAIFTEAVFQNTCLQSCDLQFAKMRYCNLRGALLGNSNFTHACLASTDMDDLDLANCNFEHTDFRHARLSGTVARGASFSNALFCEAGLAEVNWQDCDLRNCNFENSAFHLGSTRCGLVDSPYPSHGTRTGFYTDDYEDLYFKKPESIRKAALCGCDLRGANIAGTDFYLVDLRGAKYSPEQHKHFVACGAIL